MYWNDEYGEDVPFSFEGEVEFSGVTAYCDSISSLEELEIVMEEFVNLDEYKFISNDTHKISIGVSYVWKFAPEELDK